VIPPFAQVHLHGKWTSLLSFRSGRFAFGDALSTALGRLLYKSRLRFLPLYTATVVRGMVTPAATALRLFPRGRASTGEVGAPTCDAPGCVSAVTLRVAKTLAALALQRAFWSHVLFHRHLQAADSVSDLIFDILLDMRLLVVSVETPGSGGS